jgi:hypothetical protein
MHIHAYAYLHIYIYIYIYISTYGWKRFDQPENRRMIHAYTHTYACIYIYNKKNTDGNVLYQPGNYHGNTHVYVTYTSA